MATELAKAYVQIIPSAQGIQGSITDALSGESKSAGTSSGKSLASSLVSSLKSTVVGLGIGKIISDGIADTSAFETAMAKVNTLFDSSKDVTFEGLQQDILKLSSAYGVGATTLAEAAYSAESAGVSVENISAMLEGSAQLATAGFTDIDTALSATAKTMNAYGMEAEDMNKVQKVLIQTQNLGITTVGELGASLANVTPTAAAMGVSFEQVGAAMAELTATGVPTAQATTQLRAAMSELGKTGTKADKAFRAAAKGTKYAGMSFQEAMASGATLGDVFGTMQEYADKTGKSMVDLWGSVEAGNAAMVIAADLETFDKNLAAMATEADVVGEAYNKMADTFGNDMNRLKESAKNFMTTLFQGGDISSSFDQLLGSLGDVGERIGTWLTNGLKSIGQNLPNLVSSLWDFGGSIIDSLAKVDWISLGTTIINGIIGALGTLGQKLITLVGNAINAIVNGDINFGEIGTAIWNGVVSVITTTGDWLKNLFNTAKTAICGEGGINFGEIGSKILEGVKSVIDEAGKFLAKLFGYGRDAASGEDMNYGNIGSAILDGVKKFITETGSFLADLFKEGISAVESLPWPSVGDFIKTGLNLALKGGEFLVAALEGGRKLINGIPWENLGAEAGNLICTGLKTAGQLVEVVGKSAMDLLSGVHWGQIGEEAGNLLCEGLKTTTKLVETIGKAAADLLSGVKWENIGNSAGELICSGLKGAAKIVDAVSDAAYRLVKGVKWENIGEDAGRLVCAGLKVASDFVGAIGGAANRLISSIPWEAIGESSGGLLCTGLKAAAKLTESLTGAANRLITSIPWEDIGREAGGLFSKGLGGLGDLLGGVLSGAGSVAEGGGKLVGKAAGWLADTIFGSDMEELKKATETLKQAMTDLEGVLSKGKDDVYKTAQSIGSGIKNGIAENCKADIIFPIGAAIIEAVINGMNSKMVDLSNKVGELCNSAKTKFESYDDTWKGIGETHIVGNIIAGIAAKLDLFKNGCGALMDNGIAEMKGKDWRGVGTHIVTTISGAISSSSNISNAVITKANEAISAFRNQPWYNAGSALSQGIANGISSSAYLIYSQVRAIASATMSLIRNLFGIHSPSRVMREQVGRWIPAGIAEGIEMYTGLVDNAIDQMATGMTGGLQSALTNQANGFNLGGIDASNDDTSMENISAGVDEQNELLREQNSLLRRILEKEATVRIGASAGFGRTVSQSLAMYSAVGG